MNIRIFSFFTVVTFLILMYNEIPLGLAILMLIPATFMVAIVCLLAYEEVLVPLYKWFGKK